MSPSFSLTVKHRLAITLVALVAISTFSPARVQGQSSLKESTSLGMIPADASMYSSSLRYREIYDLVVESNAFAELKKVPAVNMGMMLLNLQLSNPQVAGILADPANKQLLELLKEMVSDEIFVYADPSHVKFTRLMMKLNTAQSFGPMIEQMNRLKQLREQEAQPNADDQDIQFPDTNPLAQVSSVLDALKDNIEELQAPQFVCGFKIKKAVAAEAQLQRLEMLLSAVLSNIPELKERLTHEKVAGVDYLTFKVDGSISLIPWDQIPLEQLESEPGEYKAIIDHLKKLTLTVSLGVKDNYLLLSFGPNNEHLAKLGQGPLLADRPELQRLNKFADRRLTSISYISKEINQSIQLQMKDLTDSLGSVEELLPNEIDTKLKEQISADIKELGEDIQKQLPITGAVTSVSFLNEQGIERYKFAEIENNILDGSKKLPILDHVGDSPLFFHASRSKHKPQDYDLAVKWFTKIEGYLEALVVPQLDAEDAALYRQLRKSFDPLLTKLDQTNRQNLIPALEDGQGAFVIDASVAAKQWFGMMPPGSVPLPLPQLALVIGVSDASKLKKAFSDYFVITNEFLAKLHEITKEETPNLQLPPPQVKTEAAGEIYYYLPPAMLGINQQIAPNAGLSEQIGILSLTPKLTSKLLKKSTLSVQGPLADRDRALASACYFDFAGLVDTIRPWVDYGMKMSSQLQTAQIEDNGEEADPLAPILTQVYQVMDIIKSFQGYSSVSYLEDGLQVTHGQLHFQDLPEK